MIFCARRVFIRDRRESIARERAATGYPEPAKGRPMSTLVIIIILILLFGGGGGYYAHGRYGGAGLGGVLGTVLVVLVVLWLVGGIH
jgi:hypothetical protein